MPEETTTTTALVLHGAKDLRLEIRSTPTPLPHEVQIQIKATGLCGSDLHYYTSGHNGPFHLSFPLVLGHESSGIITLIPPHSTSSSKLQVGDRVALEVGLPCRSCRLCTTGRYNLCPTLKFRSSAKSIPHVDGTLQGIITHDASMCHVLPENVSLEEGALVEPLAVCLHAINRSQGGGALVGSSALVLGAGAVGMLTSVALSVLGVTRVLVADIDAERLEISRTLGGGRFGVTTHLLPKKPPAESVEEKLVDAASLAEQLCGVVGVADGFDRVFECTGVPSCVQTGCYAAAAGGKLVLVGMGNPVHTVPLGVAAVREVDIIGVFRYANCYPAAIELFASGKLKGVAEGLVTHRVESGQGERAFRVAAGAGREGEGEGRVAVKVVVTW